MRDLTRPPVFADLRAAAERIAGHAVRTPLLSSPALDAMVGGKVLIKPEILQRTGSFKFRGAFNALSCLTPEERARGVVAFSSGNHAQGIAEAARLLGVHARIVMPVDAPQVKVEGVRASGSEIITYDRETDDREEICRALAAQTGAAVIPAFEHPDVMAGQGTCGLEIFDDLTRQAITADQLVCCVGGGGLIAGIGLAAETLSPATRLFGAEPEDFDDHARSLLAGHRVSNTRKSGSICDALMSPEPGVLTFAVNQRLLAGVGVVSDAEVLSAMRFAFTRLKLVVEPGGAVALASILSGRIDCTGRTTVVVLTGGNVDPALFIQAIGGA